MRRLSFSDAGARRLDILAIGAHPDDIEIGCGGTMLRLVADDLVASVRWVVCSGTADARRRGQGRRCRDSRGRRGSTVIVLTGRDGFFPLAGVDIKDQFEDLKGWPEPDLILTHRRDDRHQDHRFISDLTWQTFRST